MGEGTAELSLFAIGASAGGVHAIQNFLRALPSSFRSPIVIVQHLPRGPRLDFNLIYGARPGRRITEVEDKMMPQPGDVIMAAPGYHLSVERDGTLSLSQDEPVLYSRPSIDVFFKSVALSYGSRAAAYLLSGANHDGAQGLLAVHRAGGLTLVQDLSEAENSAMPKAALDLFQPDQILGAAKAANFIAEYAARKQTDESVESKGSRVENENSYRRRP